MARPDVSPLRIVLLPIIVALFGISGCGQESPSDQLHDKIVNWQSRERQAEPHARELSKNRPVTPDLLDALANLREDASEKIAPRTDGTDYWQTSQETLKRGAGDCEDFCSYVLHQLYELSGTGLLSQEQIWCTITRLPSGTLHVYAKVYDAQRSNFWVLDNGAMTSQVIDKEALFSAMPTLPTYIEYNLFNAVHLSDP